MNKVWAVVMFLVLPLIFTLQVNAQEISETKPFISMGLVHGSKFNIVGAGEQMNLTSSGFNISAEVEISSYVGVEVNYMNLSNFKIMQVYENMPIKSTELSFNVKTTMLNLKLGYPIGKYSIKPYVIVGLGLTTISNKIDIVTGSGSYSYMHKSSNNKCSKIGFGFEGPIYKRISIGTELDWWKLKKKGGKIEDGRVEFYDLKFSMFTAILNLKYKF